MHAAIIETDKTTLDVEKTLPLAAHRIKESHIKYCVKVVTQLSPISENTAE